MPTEASGFAPRPRRATGGEFGGERMSGTDLDLLLVNPGGREQIYQQLGAELTAVEPPLWCRLIAGYIRDRNHTVAILDSEAEGISPSKVAAIIAERRPRLVGVVVFGHQP